MKKVIGKNNLTELELETENDKIKIGDIVVLNCQGRCRLYERIDMEKEALIYPCKTLFAKNIEGVPMEKYIITKIIK